MHLEWQMMKWREGYGSLAQGQAQDYDSMSCFAVQVTLSH